MLTSAQKVKLLASEPMLAGMPSELMVALANLAEESAHGAGDFIYGRSDPADDLYFLVRGGVSYPEVRTGGASRQGPSAHVETGRLFGFGAALLGHARRAVSALCVDSTLVLRVGGRKAIQACSRYGGRGQRLVEKLVRAHAQYERNAAEKLAWPSLDKLTCRVSTALNKSWFDCELGRAAHSHVLSLVGPLEFIMRAAAPFVDERAGNHICTALSSGSVVGDDLDQIGFAGNMLWDQLSCSDTTVEAYLRSVAESSATSVAWSSLSTIMEEFGLDTARDPLMMKSLSREESLYVRFLGQACGSRGLIVVNHSSWGKSAAERHRAADFVRAVADLTASRVLFLTEDVGDAIRISSHVLLADDASMSSGYSLVMDFRESVCGRKGASEALGCSFAPRWGSGRTKSTPTGEHLPSSRLVRETPEGRSPFEADYLADDVVGLTAAEPSTNELRDRLCAGTFFWSVEFIPSRDRSVRDELAQLVQLESSTPVSGAIAAYSVTDRVHSDQDPDPTLVALHLKKQCGRQPMVHFSGKDREVGDLSETLCRMEKYGLENILIVSGDRLKSEPADRRVRYLESVAAIKVARATMPHLFIGAALNPFKYTEEEAMAQYLKLGKKVAAGADFGITQLGFDMKKYHEALQWVRGRDYGIPLVANVMPLTARTARFIRRRVIPGITITDSLMELLEADEEYFDDCGQARVWRRLALQIVALKRLGYAGVQLTGIHSSRQLRELQASVEAVSREYRDVEEWQWAWNQALTFPGQSRRATLSPGQEPWYMDTVSFPARRGTSRAYEIMDWIHDFAFGGGLGARIVRPVLRAGADGGLSDRVERLLKGPLLGCESCGMCRLAATQYICPETCPKGLANGPCGGTQGNRCEFGDRECVHSVKYRRARDAGVLEQLETWLIPAVPAGRRGASSWPAHFRGQGPEIEIVQPNRVCERKEPT
jgi:methylenetetrahydrofolate reductase (NADPH)